MILLDNNLDSKDTVFVKDIGKKTTLKLKIIESQVPQTHPI